MKSMKKYLCTLSAALLFSLAACGGTTRSTGDTAVTTTKGATAETTAADSTPSGETQTLIVYYSATGSTKKVAEAIADASGGDLFEVTPSAPYTSDDLNWRDAQSRVSREHDDASLRTVALAATAAPNWEKYDTVYVGYPIWWGIAAWPLSSFVAANDFTGKTVIPFCTSSSSGLGDSAAQLAAAAGGAGNWQPGHRFSSGADRDEIAAWVASL